MEEVVGMKIESGGGRIQSPSQPSLRGGRWLTIGIFHYLINKERS